MTPRPRPGRRRGRFLAQSRAALLRLSARPLQVPAGVLTREQEAVFRAHTRRVDLLHAWYADAAAELQRPGMPALPAHDAGRRPESEGPTASRGAS